MEYSARTSLRSGCAGEPVQMADLKNKLSKIAKKQKDGARKRSGKQDATEWLEAFDLIL